MAPGKTRGGIESLEQTVHVENVLLHYFQLYLVCQYTNLPCVPIHKFYTPCPLTGKRLGGAMSLDGAPPRDISYSDIAYE